MKKSIEIFSLTKTYKLGFKKTTLTAVNELSFDVPEGVVFGLLGPNGAGKTTTLKAIMGFIRPDKGKILIQGKEHSDISTHQEIGFLSEQPYFYLYHTVESALEFYGKLFKIPKKIRKEKINQLLEKVNLSSHRKMVLKKLSKGMLQRLSIAQSLINDPNILILDEPISGLDPHGQIEIRNLITSLGNEGKTIIISSHLLSEVEKICEHIAIIDKGRLIISDATKNLTYDEGYYSLVIRKDNKNVIVDLKNISTGFKASEETIEFKIRKDTLNQALDIIKANNIEIASLNPYRKRLEDLFLELTGGDS
ncbi:MAG: ABC transporter ATP-binding protein [Actinomycetia bacterium]|nr:ABC transporter ATP-binding protein [Actinomycetes bacterium]